MRKIPSDRLREGEEAMGTFFVEVQIAHPARPEQVEPVKLLVDTGSAYTWVSGTVLRERLGLAPITSRRVLTIEGRAVERQAAEVLIALEGQTLHTLCLFGEQGELEVLGAYTLEGFGLSVDPVQRRLVPAILYGAAVIPLGTDLATLGGVILPSALRARPTVRNTRSGAK